MNEGEEWAGLAVVTDHERGGELKRRRVADGIKSVREFVEATKRLGMPVSREAITAAEAGEASDNTYARLEAFLDRWEEETSHDRDEEIAPAAPNLVKFRVHGNFGVDVVVEGPVEDADELERVVERLIRGMQRNDRPDSEG